MIKPLQPDSSLHCLTLHDTSYDDTSSMRWRQPRQILCSPLSYVSISMNLIPPPSYNTWHSWPYYACQCIILSLNILNNILEKIMKIWYFENNNRDESNDILYDNIYLCILIEKYGQSKLGQNCTFPNKSSIAGRRE